MRVFITKYALTEGILEVEAEIKGDMVSYRRAGSSFTAHSHGEGREWHKTLPSAQTKFDFMRLRKIESLRKKIHQLEVMKPKLRSSY